MKKTHVALSSILLVVASIHAADKKVVDAPEMVKGRQMGVTMAQLFNQGLTTHADDDFPGTTAWLKGDGKIFDDLDKDHPTDDWRHLDAEKRVLHSPEFWQMYYEVAPADEGLAMLQAGCLLACGESKRATAVLRIVLMRGDVNPDMKKYFVAVMRSAEDFNRPSYAIVQDGLKLHDAGKFDTALEKYDEALKLWPQNGWAHYEQGFTLRMKSDDFRSSHQDIAEVLRAFAKSRRFDPFQFAAWQGHKDAVPGMVTMMTEVHPLWDKCLKSLDFQMTDEELKKFGEQLQEAQVDDLALVTRQVLVSRRGRYAPEDHPFISLSLRRLVPDDRTEKTLGKLAGSTLKAFRLWAAPEK